MIGRVVSTKMNNTATVLVERLKTHPLYKKTYVQSKNYLADMGVKVALGDMVEIVKVRPISKNKHWRITKVIGKSLAEINESKLKTEAEKVIAEVMPEPSDAKAMEGKEKEEVSKKNEELSNKKETVNKKKEIVKKEDKSKKA